MRNLDFGGRCVVCSILAFVFVPTTTDFDGILNCLFHSFSAVMIVNVRIIMPLSSQQALCPWVLETQIDNSWV